MIYSLPINQRASFSIRAVCLALGLFSIGSTLFIPLANAATFTAAKSEKPNTSANSDTLYYRMTGAIVAGDAAKLQGIFNEKKADAGKTNVWLHMDARSGDLEEAFRIGRLLRKYKAYTSYGQCVGSCVYAFMGGNNRFYTPAKAQSDLPSSSSDMTGLWAYEPYVMEKVLPMAASNPIIAQALKNVKDYTTEMTGKTKFYDSTIKIPHTKPVRMIRNDAFGMNVCNLDAKGGNTTLPLPASQKPPA